MIPSTEAIAINRHMLVGISRLLAIFFTLQTLPWTVQNLFMTFIAYPGSGVFSGAAGLGPGSSFLARVWQVLAQLFQSGAIVSCAALCILIFLIFRSRWLVDKIAPFPKQGACPRCRYDFGGNHGNACPECGLCLTVQAVDPAK